MKRLLILMGIVFLLSACTSIREREEPIVYKGYYIGGNEVRTYRLDGTEEWMWVVDNTSEVEKKYQSFKLKPYEEVYLEVEGVIRDNDTPGELSENYEKLIEIHTIIKITPLVN